MDNADPYRRMPAAGAKQGHAAPAPAGFGPPRPRPEGLGGWLAVLAVVLLLWLAAGAAVFAAILILMSSSHAPTGDGLIRAQYLLATSGTLFLVKLAVLALMWLRSRWFARAFVAWLIVDLVVSAVFWIAVETVPAETVLSVSLLCAARLVWNGGWIAYALKSERVRNTFSARAR